MRPQISALVKELTYPELTDAPSTHDRPKIEGLRGTIIFIDHKSLEVEGNSIYDPRHGGPSSSKTNHFEAEMTLKCVRYLAQQGYGSDSIVVLTPYLGQLRLLYDVLQAENDPVLNDLDSYDLVRAGLMPAATAQANKRRLRVSTIDNYQGEESDIVIGSLTRSNARGDIGFMSAPERLNVLISRARNGMILLGNSETFLAAHKSKEMWTRFLTLLRENHHIYDGLPVYCRRHPTKQASLEKPTDFNTLCPDGGCDAPCDSLLECGIHKCASKCHQLYDHSKMKCVTPVIDKCSDGHPLPWICFEQRPAVCLQCEKKRKYEEQKKHKEHERLAGEALQQKEHDERIAQVEALIEVERQRIKKITLQEDQDRAHQQKLDDLERAREAASRAEQAQRIQQSQEIPGHKPQQRESNELQNYKSPFPDETRSSQSDQSSATQRWEKLKTLHGLNSHAIDELMTMTGLETIKDWSLNQFEAVQTATRQGLQIEKERMGSILLGNPGTGKTTVARILAKFFQELDVIKTSEFVETTGSKLSNEGIAGTKKVLESMLSAGGGVIFIDEAYQLVSGNSYGGTAVLDYLLAEIENNTGKLIFMFAGYQRQMEKFFHHNPGLPSRLPHKLCFADYTEPELLKMLQAKIVKKYRGKMQVDDGLAGLYMRIVVRRLHRLSGQEGFGNARALENALSKITSAQSARLSRARSQGLRPDNFWLSKEDLIGPEPSNALKLSEAWPKLQRMVGLSAVKTAIQILLDRLVDNYARELKEKPPIEVSLNRLFLGSPGTGKTTVAKLYGQILAEIGVLSSFECVVRTPADFIGSVVGESEKNTKAILNDTRGKVLVLDEAYMLSSSGSMSGGDIYRTAVIDTIVS